MKQVTKFGVFTKVIRAERGITLTDMARSLGLSPSFLSLIESGQRRACPEIVSLLIERYDLDETKAKEAWRAFEESAPDIKIDLRGVGAKRAYMVRAIKAKLNELDDLTIDKICDILEI